MALHRAFGSYGHCSVTSIKCQQDRDMIEIGIRKREQYMLTVALKIDGVTFPD
ncbi:hypothetical protein L4D06_10260 [Enterovibrio makurazakiensis]|uniref:hypothetical protein n=1 Tax=Enterovibrio makurazakiensis TaxID=2910232 RepID=UPI003D22D4F4